MQGMTPVKITSRDNPRLKEARKVRDGKIDRSIFVEGLRLAEEAVRSGILIEHCIVREGFGSDAREQDLVESFRGLGADILEADARTFSSLADTNSPQGVILICTRPLTDRYEFETALMRQTSKLDLTVLLDRVNNPANLGAVIRTAEAAGAKGVILTQDSADAFGTKAIRASMGSVFRIPIWSDAGPAEIEAFAGRTGATLTGVSTQGSLQYTEIDWKTPRVVAFGSEAHGLSDEIESLVQDNISIRMDNDVESLNLAVAAGIVLFEARRQWAID